MNETVHNLVNAIAAGDALETQNAFAAAMAEKLSTRLDDMRAEVAQSMFAGQETQEEVAEETPAEQEQQVG
jgi:thymidine phosphorylase